MLAKTLLEQRAMFLQKLAYEILTNPGMRLAHIANLAGDPTLFDKDLSSILSILFAHDNLKSENVSAAEQPIKILEQIYQDLEVHGFKLPNFKRRYEWAKSTTSGSFRNDKKQFEGGETRALDRPLRRLRESFYELRMHDTGHVKDNLGRVLTKNTGPELTALVDNLIAAVKKLETEGASYAVDSDEGRAGKGRTEFLDKRYDELAALLNRSVGTAAEGPLVTLYHLHSEALDSERWYAVPEEEFPGLIHAVLSARPDWNADENTKYEYVDQLVASASTSYQVSITFHDASAYAKARIDMGAIKGKLGGQISYSWKDNQEDGSEFSKKLVMVSPRKDLLERVSDKIAMKHQGTLGLMRGGRSVEQAQAEEKLLHEISQPSANGAPIVRMVRLPFTPDQIDDAFPSVEVREDEYLGKHVSKIVLELIRKSRFSGFVEFDDKYRMMILWANAPSDDQKDGEGNTFRDHLIEILKDHSKNFAGLLGQVPEIIKTKTGAALYFPKPASIPRIVKGRTGIEKAIEAVNADIEAMEQHTRIERGFNRRIDDDELPVGLEEVG